MTKNNIYGFFLFLASILIALFIGEIICRIRPKYLTYSEKSFNKPFYCSLYTPGETGWLHVWRPNIIQEQSKGEFINKFHTNSLGLPDREYSKEKPSHVYRIAALGDSFTEGVGAPPDSSWPRLLQGLLRDSFPDSTEVMNCGVSGSDPIFEYMLIKQKLLDYHPDMIMVAFNESDIIDCMTRGGFERFQMDGTVKYHPAPKWEWLYAKSFLFRRYIHDVQGYNYLLLSAQEDKARRIEAMEALKHCVDSLSRLCTENHCDLILIFHPSKREVIDNKLDVQPVLDYANKKGIATVNVMDSFMVPAIRNNVQNYFWPLDLHNNASGYVIFAQAVADKIKQLGH
jgi:lysophospholipase L1-like esterase